MKESNLEIKVDPYFKNFIKNRRLSKSTVRVYTGRLRSFCEFLDKNPIELIQEAQKNHGLIEENLNEYIESLQLKGKSSRTIVNSLDTVKAFYNEFDIDTEDIKRIISPEIDQLTPKKIISLNEINEALELSSLRDKAIILLHLSSGMEATEIRNLTYEDFINSIEEYLDLDSGDKFAINKIANTLFKEDQLVGTWKIEKHRTGKIYTTFNSPESTRAILSYLIDRKRKNKTIKSLKDPLFVNSRNEGFNKSAYGSIFKRVNDRANFGYITKRRRFFSSTMLRKYFKSKLQDSGVDEATISALLGQNLDDNVNYPTEDGIRILKDKYINALGSLSIEPLEIKKLKRIDSDEYYNLMKKLDEKDKELNEIKKQLEQIKQSINNQPN
jgi:site-specific recombinase XerD